MRAKLLLFASLWLVVATVIFAAPGCYGENCNGGFVQYGDDPGQGHMIDDTHWESNGVTEAWLPFPRQRGYGFNIAALGGRTPYNWTAYLSANEHQNEPGANNVIGAGNIAEFVNVRPNGLDVRNDTCSDYYIRVTIEVPPLPPAAPTASAPPPDAGAP